MKKFIIEESEKERILGMHKTAIQKQYLNEQGPLDPAAFAQTTDTLNINYAGGELPLKFIDNTNRGGETGKYVTLTATIQKTPDKKDNSGNIIKGGYVMYLDSDSSNFRVRLDQPCGAPKVTQVIEDPKMKTVISNPPQGTQGQNIADVLKKATITSTNPFIQKFKQDYCQA